MPEVFESGMRCSSPKLSSVVYSPDAPATPLKAPIE
jgi:hypothetical protein